MQVCVTRKNFNKDITFSVKSVISSILIFVMAFISIVFLINMKKKNLIYEEQYFYFVYASSSKKVSVLDKQKDYLKNLGGASISYFYKDDFYLIANVYLNSADGDEIKQNLLPHFQNAGVVTIKTNKILKASQKKINENEQVKKFLKYLYQYNRAFYELSMGYFIGEISDSEFISKIIKNNLVFEEYKNKISDESELGALAKDYAALMSLQFSSFLNNFYLSSNKQNYVSAYYVGFVINYIEFYNSL